MTISLVLLIVAFVLFLLAAFAVIRTEKVNLIALGLAFVTLAELLAGRVTL